MTKAYSKAAKRRAKKARDLPELAKTEGKKSRGRARMKEIQEDAQKAVLNARKKQTGVEDKNALRSEILSEPAGQALWLSLAQDDAHRLWGHYKALTAAQRRYHASLGVSVHAKTAKTEYQPEAFEVRDDDRPDLRTEDERDEAAAKAWRIWCDRLDEIGLSQSAAIHTAIQGFTGMVDAGKVTLAGTRFVAAMQALDKMCDRSEAVFEMALQK